MGERIKERERYGIRVELGERERKKEKIIVELGDKKKEAERECERVREANKMDFLSG